ncbi:hypothetical protein C0L86_09915 [Streptomyces sp. SCA2-2]|nr:hypothetical protein C0L86_09915 [Streptomyces sp. SCA2-2]
MASSAGRAEFGRAPSARTGHRRPQAPAGLLVAGLRLNRAGHRWPQTPARLLIAGLRLNRAGHRWPQTPAGL